MILSACQKAPSSPEPEGAPATDPTAITYDIVIANGRVMDPETNFDGVRNVGVKDGRIVAITEADLQGAESIDASGHVVAPGFIDTHSHWPRTMGYKLGLRDGLTTAMDLEYGCGGTKVAQWYDDREGKTQMNYGTASSHEGARQIALDGSDVYDAPGSIAARAPEHTGWSHKKPSLAEANRILQIIDKGLQDGAVGIGSTLGYMREGVTAREFFEVQKVGARYGRHTGVHTRHTPGTEASEVNGAQELLANAIALGAPASVNHFNNPGWDVVHELLTRLRERGFNVWGEIYPYAAGSTTLNAVFIRPEIWIEQLGHRYEDTLFDPVNQEFYTQETYEQMIKDDPTREILLYKMPEEDSLKWLELGGETMAADGMWAEPADAPWDTPYEELSNMHPRGSGARGLSLRLGRENQIPLMQTLAQLSYNSAKHLGDEGLEAMQVRGRMQEGMVADITIFDPENVRENSTYANGTVPTTGIPYVLVNGVVVVRDSVVQRVFPGQPIRFAPEPEPRFEALDPAKWARIYMTGLGDGHPDPAGCLPHPSTHPGYFARD